MGRQVPSLTPYNTLCLDSRHVLIGHQGPRGHQIPSLTPQDTFHPNVRHILRGRQVPYSSPRTCKH